MRKAAQTTVAALLAAVALAGCAGQEDLSALVVGSDCPTPLGRAACSTQDGWVRVQGLDLAPRRSQDSGTGLIIRPEGANVAIDNAHIAGFFLGVQVDFSRCGSCTVRLSNVTVEANRTGIQVLGEAGLLELESAVIVTGGGGTVIRTEREENGTSIHLTTVLNGADGILLAEKSALRLTARNLLLSALRPSAGDGIGGMGPWIGSADIRGLTVSGYRVAMHLMADELRLEDVAIDCNETALMPSGVLYSDIEPDWTLEGRNIRSHGCTHANLQIGAFTTVDLAGIDLRGGTRALEVASPYFDIRNFRIEDADYGIFMEGDNVGRIRASYVNGYVANHTYGGIQAKYERVLVENVTFLNNGHGWPDPDVWVPPGHDIDARVYGGLYLRYPLFFFERNAEDPAYDIHGSSFLGNVPYGLSAINLLTDARMNWWNSSDGPQIYSAGGRSPDVPVTFPPVAYGGHGDNVTQGVLFAPFLTSPPGP